MKSMKFKRWAGRGVSSVLLMAIVATYSMVSLAASSKPIGELSFSGNSVDAVVTVNGEVAKSGRTLFGDSTVSTAEGAQAIINIGKGIKLQLAPNTTFALSGEQAVAGSLMSGNLTVISSPDSVTVRNLAGELVKLNAGESVEATASSAVKQSGRYGGLEPWQLALIIGAAVAVVIIVVAVSGDDDSRPTSPIR